MLYNRPQIHCTCTLYTTCTGVSEGSPCYHSAFEYLPARGFNYLINQQLITCVMKHWHQQDFLVFVTWENLLMNHSLYYFIMRIEIWKTIVGNPWSVALHLPPVGHNTEYFGEQNILLYSLKCMTFFLIYQGQMKVTVL